ncbi:MAG: Fe-S cluster assembly ATPase SufC, partial [Balneolaceae bacterium]
AVLNPKLAFLDETDSGLDIDALKIVADGINHLSSEDNAFVLVTHYQRILDYVVPDHVHIMIEGRIVKSGGKNLAVKLEEEGYDWVADEASVSVNGEVN